MPHILNIFIIVIAIILFLSTDLISKIIIQIFVILFLILLFAVINTFQNKKKEEQKEEKEDNKTVIGIDLGTTYSRVGVYKDDSMTIITNDQGESLIPSYVAFTDDGVRLIGSAAKNQLVDNPQNTIYNVQRLMGCQWADQTVQENIENLSFNVIEQNNQLYITIHTARGEETFAPELISAMIIDNMKGIAERYLERRVTHAIITVPANFNDAQRRAVETAVTVSGLNVSSLVSASSAAAIAYDLNKKKCRPFWARLMNDSRLFGREKRKIVLVYDLGGGHFDCSLISIDNGNFAVLSTDGNTRLGGEDFNRRVVNYLINLYEEKTGRDVRQDSRALQKLRIKVEQAKIALSDSHEVPIEIESLVEAEDFVEISLTREKFGEINNDLFVSTIAIVSRVLQEANIIKEDIDEVILVGGSTRIPKIQQLVKDFFEGRELYMSVDESVSFAVADQTNKQGTGVINVRNVTPFSLGLEDEGGWVSEIIPKNSVIPNKHIVYPETSRDGQNSVIIKVYEGEKGMPENTNRLLGEFELTNIRPAPAGKANIEVTLEINKNGILQVTAEEKETGNRRQIAIVYDNNRRSSQDIEQMIRDFERYAEQ